MVMGKSATHSMWYKRSAATRYRQGADVKIEMEQVFWLGKNESFCHGNQLPYLVRGGGEGGHGAATPDVATHAYSDSPRL
jgi:hypothetical protein